MRSLAAVTRNHYIESIHQGYICVADIKGNILYHAGDYKARIFYRSSAKPIQVIPFIHSGAARALGFTDKEIALACSSHSGEPIHQKTVLQMLKRANLDENYLHCGVMSPYNIGERDSLIKKGEKPTPLHVSCSGKHAAMLALSVYWGYDVSTYEKPEHPVQKEVLKTVAEFADEDEKSIPAGTDGCGLPIYMLPVHKIAQSYARLVSYAQDSNSPYHDDCRTVFNAMTSHPEMVAGEGEFDTELMRVTGDKLIGKVGAEAVYCMGIKKERLGICIKIADGSERAVYPVVIQTLLQLGILSGDEYEQLKQWHCYKLLNNREEHIGDICPVFQLEGELRPGDRL